MWTPHVYTDAFVHVHTHVDIHIKVVYVPWCIRHSHVTFWSAISSVPMSVICTPMPQTHAINPLASYFLLASSGLRSPHVCMDMRIGICIGGIGSRQHLAGGALGEWMRGTTKQHGLLSTEAHLARPRHYSYGPFGPPKALGPHGADPPRFHVHGGKIGKR